MSRIDFIDTSVLCNLVPVPGRDQDSKRIREEMAQRTEAGTRFILPITSVIETGNFIAQISDGVVRRNAATNLEELLRMVIASNAPWTLHEISWDKGFLEHFLAGGGSQTPYVEHAQNQVGAGDLCILTERDHYARRTGIDAGIWTLDRALAAHN